MSTTKGLEDELYRKLKALGVNVEALKRLNLPLHQLDDFYQRINSLMYKHAGWFGDIN